MCKYYAVERNEDIVKVNKYTGWLEPEKESIKEFLEKHKPTNIKVKCGECECASNSETPICTNPNSKKYQNTITVEDSCILGISKNGIR